MEKEKVRNLVEVTAPREEDTESTFSDAQLTAFRSGQLNGYDEALDLLDKRDITLKKGKYKWKDK